MPRYGNLHALLMHLDDVLVRHARQLDMTDEEEMVYEEVALKIATVMGRLENAAPRRAALRSELLHIASELPKGDQTRRGILAALSTDKEAGAHDVLWSLVDRREFFKLSREMTAAGDQQSADLLREVFKTLGDRLKLSNNEEMALNRLRNGLSSLGRWDAATHRNNIFKIANLLGIKLPSAMF